MILYHPYRDANHCAYRLISIMYSVNEEISFDFLSIADFFYLFPSELKELKNWPRKNSRDYMVVQHVEDCHENMGNAPMIFYEMKEIRHNAFLSLISRGIVTATTSSRERYKLVHHSLPPSLIKLLEEDQFRKSDVFQLIMNLSKLPVKGQNGLKAKTGLLEYRYDS